MKNVNNKLCMLSKIRRNVNNSTAVIIYKSMVLPYLEFASCFLIGCNQGDKKKLQRLQNRGLKIALNKDRLYGTEQLHIDAKISTWENRAMAAVCKLIYKHKYNDEYVISGIETRLDDGPVFYIVRPNTEWFARSTAYVSRKAWNSLPAQIRLIDNHDEFKRAIKRHFNTSQQTSINDARRDTKDGVAVRVRENRK